MEKTWSLRILRNELDVQKEYWITQFSNIRYAQLTLATPKRSDSASYFLVLNIHLVFMFSKLQSIRFQKRFDRPESRPSTYETNHQTLC